MFKIKASLLSVILVLITLGAISQRQTNQTCRITARLAEPFFKDIKVNACRISPNSCSEILAIAREEFTIDVRWKGVRQGVYNGCTWVLKGKDLTFYVPDLAKVNRIINDLKSTRYFTSVQKR